MEVWIKSLKNFLRHRKDLERKLSERDLKILKNYTI